MARPFISIIQELQQSQLEAYNKQIDFQLNLYFNPKNIPCATVQMYYSVAGDPLETHTFSTTFSDNPAQNTIRLNKVKNFIQSSTLDTE